MRGVQRPPTESVRVPTQSRAGLARIDPTAPPWRPALRAAASHSCRSSACRTHRLAPTSVSHAFKKRNSDRATTGEGKKRGRQTRDSWHQTACGVMLRRRSKERLQKGLSKEEEHWGGAGASSGPLRRTDVKPVAWRSPVWSHSNWEVWALLRSHWASLPTQTPSPAHWHLCISVYVCVDVCMCVYMCVWGFLPPARAPAGPGIHRHTRSQSAELWSGPPCWPRGGRRLAERQRTQGQKSRCPLTVNMSPYSQHVTLQKLYIYVDVYIYLYIHI